LIVACRRTASSRIVCRSCSDGTRHIARTGVANDEWRRQRSPPRSLWSRRLRWPIALFEAETSKKRARRGGRAGIGDSATHPAAPLAAIL
jgi:hypothetical protein